MSELAEPPKSRSERPSGRFESVSEIFLGERLSLPKSRMVVDEGLMKRSRGLAESGGEIETGGRNILERVGLPTQGLPPSVAKPGEQVDRIHMIGRDPYHQAVRSLSECDITEVSSHMRKVAGMQPSQDFGFPISGVEEPVRFQDDVSRTRRDPEDNVRGVSAQDRGGPSKSADAIPMEGQGISGSGPEFRSSPKRVHHESRVDLSTFGLHHVDGTRATFEGDGFTIESGPGDRKWEMDGARACARIRRKKEEEDDGLGSRFRQDRTILYIESRRHADGVTAPPKRPKPGPQGAGRSERPIGDIDRVVESRGHHVSDRYSSRVLAAIRSHVNWRSTCRRPAFPIVVPVVGSSTMRVIAWASFAGSLGGTRSPVSSSTTTSLMPPTRVATTGVSQAIASRLMIPNGS